MRLRTAINNSGNPGLSDTGSNNLYCNTENSLKRFMTETATAPEVIKKQGFYAPKPEWKPVMAN